MGKSLSINHHDRPTESFHGPRQKISPSSFCQLIPGLPDEISLQILARIPRILYLNLKAVSRSWKSALATPQLYKIRKQLGTTEEWLYILMNQIGNADGLFWHALDPISKIWQRLPTLPSARFDSGRILHRSCAIGAVDGCLYMLGGLSAVSTLTRVWKYDPVSNSWSEANPMSVARAYCRTGVLNGKLFAVGGVSLGPDDCALTPLPSAEVFDPQTGLWSEIPSMPFSNAHAVATAYLTDIPKPVATGLASYRGKLYVPQSLYCWPNFHDVGGEVYDLETNSWADMPTGMGEGWPAKHFRIKQSVIVDGDLYALDNSTSVDKINIYNHRNDLWSEGDISTHDFPESYSICLLASLVGKLRVVAKDKNGNIAVIRADKQCDLVASSSEGTCVPNIWNVIASRKCGLAKPVSCQNLDL